MEDTLWVDFLSIKKGIYIVLILVLMEDTLWGNGKIIKICIMSVLILVLMEDTLWVFLSPHFAVLKRPVLILVLMEDTLWDIFTIPGSTNS